MTPCEIPNRPDRYHAVSVGGRTRPGHVVAYEAVHGPVPEGLELDHLCEVKGCVRVDHLEAVTHRENVSRSSRLGRPARAACRNGHPYDEANTYVIPKTGARVCRACKANNYKRWSHR